MDLEHCLVSVFKVRERPNYPGIVVLRAGTRAPLLVRAREVHRVTSALSATIVTFCLLKHDPQHYSGTFLFYRVAFVSGTVYESRVVVGGLEYPRHIFSGRDQSVGVVDTVCTSGGTTPRKQNPITRSALFCFPWAIPYKHLLCGNFVAVTAKSQLRSTPKQLLWGSKSGLGVVSSLQRMRKNTKRSVTRIYLGSTVARPACIGFRQVPRTIATNASKK